jgi:pimeloyl-ACP methyl ester carboxylesterase
LNNCYVNEEAFDEGLMQQIRDCTSGSGGHAAFASILWSPPVTVQLPGQTEEANFEACLQALQSDVLLVFGRDDPWCTPFIAKRMLQKLSERSAIQVEQLRVTERYVELSRVGHCPNHEAPKAVSQLLTAWWEAEDRSTASLVDPQQGDTAVVQEAWGETVVQERAREDIPLTFAERLAVTFV